MAARKTNIYNSYNLDILEALFMKYRVSKYYIRKCLSGNAHGPKSDDIKKDYENMEKAVNNIIREFCKENNLIGSKH
ncbi:hypothetical protein ASE21_08420 [Flavobacterium sp. Root901]|uniref:hypothetical protein n=1 Tax=Flavobacterium sp. Root901 TaxID=1736605 RepID=UPI00070A7898|nr:hypothetical protein [Flavobacterium sp. Root901]KRD11713.1 hypothetical protein ASE21_08420 [Flavobacterium sp. Root901]